MEKQIEEMANDLAKICPDLVENYCGQMNCVTHLTLSLSKIGYRRASDVAREIFEELEMCIGYCTTLLPLNVGLIDLNKIAELKKKYESEETK